MHTSTPLTCPACKNHSFTAKYEATYVYSYVIDEDAPGLKNEEELLPFLFDNREQKEARQYIKCNSCGAEYPCYFDKNSKGFDFRLS